MELPDAGIVDVIEHYPRGQEKLEVIAGWLLLKLIPKDRPSPDEVKGVVPVLPGPKNLKDIIGGVPGVLKGIVVDNVLPIYGAQPLGRRDQPRRYEDDIIEAGVAVVGATTPQRFDIRKLDDWPERVRREFLTRLENEQVLRSKLAATEEGLKLLREREIPVSAADLALANQFKIEFASRAAKKGGSNAVVAAVNGVGDTVVDSLTQLDRLFAANPPDP